MWKALGTVPPAELLDARLEAHHAVQWIARATRAYCKAEPDDSHTSMSWDLGGHALMGRSLTTDLTLGLRIEDLTLVAMSKRGDQSFSLIGQTESSVGDWLSDIVSHHDLDARKLHEPGPYTLETHGLDSGGVYGTAEKSAIEELAKYYGNATPIFEAIRATYPQASPVSCWPHYFDIATLLTFELKGSSEKTTIGVGCSPGDATYPEPYFYVSLWPYPLKENLPPAMAPSFWHLEGFTALIIPSSDLVTERNAAQQEEKVKTIIEQGVKASVELLTQ